LIEGLDDDRRDGAVQLTLLKKMLPTAASTNAVGLGQSANTMLGDFTAKFGPGAFQVALPGHRGSRAHARACP
jgi:hypothetical protein